MLLWCGDSAVVIVDNELEVKVDKDQEKAATLRSVELSLLWGNLGPSPQHRLIGSLG